MPLLGTSATLASGSASASNGLSADARLAVGADVLPGAARPFRIEVTNSSSRDLVLVGGPQIDYVSIILPSAAGVTTNPDVHAPSGWTVQVTDHGSLQRIKFQTESSPIAPGDSVAFDFPADVAAPAAGDKTGEFRVAVSSDGGATTEPAKGALRTVIRVLEVTELGALAPAGVTDQSATAGQSITYGVRVRNHARAALVVTPTLQSNHDADTVGDADPARIPSGQSRPYRFPVTLGPASGQRVATFAGGATSDSASAVQETAELLVQAPPALVLDANSFAPKFVRADVPIKYRFSVDVTKSNPPTLRLRGCTLSFASTATRLPGPVRFGPGTAAQTLSFSPTLVNGDEGAHTVRMSCDGVDGNDHPASYRLTEPNLVTIDNTPPVLTVDLDIPDGQDAVKSGDTLTIRGAVDEDAELDFVGLRSDAGETFPCTPSDTEEFECEVSPDFADGTTEVLAEAQATDRAGNVGAASSNPVAVDLVPPRLVVAHTLSTRQLLVRFDEHNVIRGGCNPAQWDVGGHLVAKVLFSNGDDCTAPPQEAGQSGPVGAPSNFRILVLADALENRDETPVVTYTRSAGGAPSDNVRDDAANLAASARVRAVLGILPPPPELVAVTRTDSTNPGERERAVKDGEGTKPDTDTHWTNQPGDDLRVEFTGARKGYRVQVVDGNGDPVGSPQKVTAESGGGVVAVPIGRVDRRYVRGLRLINAAGAGDPAYFDVVLDRVVPRINGATADGDNVAVRFTEPIPFGSDFANDWFAWEKVSGGRDYYQARRVDRTDDSAERVLTVPFEDRGPFGGVDYVFTSTGPGAARYEDRAGNALRDTTAFDAGGGGAVPGEEDDGPDESTGTAADDRDGLRPGSVPGEPRVGPAQVGDPSASDRLPVTGAPIGLALVLGLGLLAAGLLVFSRRLARRRLEEDGDLRTHIASLDVVWSRSRGTGQPAEPECNLGGRNPHAIRPSGYGIHMAAPLSNAEPVPPKADPVAIRACLTPRVAAEFDAEWEIVLDKAKQSKDLAGVHDLLQKWRHFAYSEMRDPGSYFRLLAKAEQITRTGGNPTAGSFEDMQALIRDRLGR